MTTVLIKDKIPLIGTDEESIHSAVAMVLKQAGVVKLSVDARTKVVDFWRLPSEDDKGSEEFLHPFRSRLRNVEMEEYSPEGDLSGQQQLFEMFEMIEDAGCFPVFILTGRTLVELRKWIPFPRKSSSIAGVPVLINPDLVEDTFLLCGAKVREAEPIDVEYVVKVTLP